MKHTERFQGNLEGIEHPEVLNARLPQNNPFGLELIHRFQSNTSNSCSRPRNQSKMSRTLYFSLELMVSQLSDTLIVTLEHTQAHVTELVPWIP